MKPVSLTPIEDYDSPYAPEPLGVVGGLPTSDEVQGVATVGTANATDEASVIALANALKARLNELITALKA